MYLGGSVHSAACRTPLANGDTQPISGLRVCTGWLLHDDRVPTRHQLGIVQLHCHGVYLTASARQAQQDLKPVQRPARTPNLLVAGMTGLPIQLTRTTFQPRPIRNHGMG
jgi:hypothetical protein